MRAFVAVWPPAGVVEVLQAMPRPDHPAIRWTTPDQWHVTLRFLGEVGNAEVAGLTEAVRFAASACTPGTVDLGPATARLGRTSLVVPVAGLDDVAAAVIDATRGVGAPPEERPFTGHLTLARGRGRRPVPPALAGQPVTASWPMQEVAVVRSHLGGAGARYETVARVPLEA